MALVLPFVLFSALALAGLIWMIVYPLFKEARDRKLRETQHPDEPWLWRGDWAAREAHEITPPRATLWLMAGIWCLATLPFAWLFRDRELRDPAAIMALLFLASGVATVGLAAYSTLRRRKYGTSLCRLERLPFRVGDVVRGEITTRMHELPAEGFQLRLVNLRRTVTGSGKQQRVKETVLGTVEQTVHPANVMRGPDTIRIPFRFDTPANGQPTDLRNMRDRALWRLEVRAEVPGIDYRATFELPVFP
jgi:hypothetical protein